MVRRETRILVSVTQGQELTLDSPADPPGYESMTVHPKINGK